MTTRTLVALGRAWLASSVALVVALVWSNMDILGDGFWTMAAGRIVLETHALPGRDPYAYTSTAHHFILQMPATEIGLAWLGDHAGLHAVLLVTTVAVGGAVTWVWLAHARSVIARVVTLPVALFVVFLQKDDLSVRGQAFGDLAFAALLACMMRLSARARAPTKWLTPIALGAFWANVHPSFLLAVLVPLLWAAVRVFDAPPNRSSMRAMATFAALAAAGATLNPYGPELVADVVRLAANPTTSQIDLFASPDFHSPWPLALVGLSVATMLLSLRWGRAEHRASNAAMVAVFLGASCVARRYGPLAAMVDLAILGGVADASLAHVTVRLRDHARVPLAMATLAILELTAAARLASAPKDALFQVPAASAAFIDAHALPDRVFAPYHWGGYLEWAWRGRRKVFVDGRNQVFPASVLEDARAIESAASDARGEDIWERLLETYEVATVLVENGSPLDARLHVEPRWFEAHRDTRASVYVRRAPLPR